VDLKKIMGKKKDQDDEEEDSIFFEMDDQKNRSPAPQNAPREGVQTFTVQPEPHANPQAKDSPAAGVPDTDAVNSLLKKDERKPGEEGPVNDQLQDLSSNLKNLVYDFRSFMSEAGSPFNPNEIPATNPDTKQVESGTGSASGVNEAAGAGYISAQSAGAGDKEALESPADVESKFEKKYLTPTEKLRIDHILENPKSGSSALSQFKDALDASRRGTKFSNELKSNLDSADMPALIRAVNSTDYLLHAVGRKNLLKILEVGTREGWIRPEVERLVLSVAEILSTAGLETDERVINVNDLLRVVYYLNRLLDPEISDFLSLNAAPLTKSSRSSP
jgi:archaellum component FlaD/FlaE